MNPAKLQGLKVSPKQLDKSLTQQGNKKVSAGVLEN